MTVDEIMEAWRQYLLSPEGLRYIARRVRIGSRAVTREWYRLDDWLRDRAPFNSTRV